MISKSREWEHVPDSVRSIKIRLAVCAVLAALMCQSCGPPSKAVHRELAPRDYTDQKAPTATTAPKPDINKRFALEIDEERVDLTREYFYLHNRVFFEEMADRPGPEALVMEPQVVVVHFTAIPSLSETLEYFGPNRIAADRDQVTQNGDLNVGTQFIVDRDGRIYQFYPENAVSRHVIGLNHLAIGIENVGEADLGEGETGLTHAQLDANVALVRYLLAKYPQIEFVIGHYEYRDFEDPKHPGWGLFVETLPDYRTEKVDPGRRFMDELRSRLKKPRARN